MFINNVDCKHEEQFLANNWRIGQNLYLWICSGNPTSSSNVWKKSNSFSWKHRAVWFWIWSALAMLHCGAHCTLCSKVRMHLSLWAGGHNSNTFIGCKLSISIHSSLRNANLCCSSTKANTAHYYASDLQIYCLSSADSDKNQMWIRTNHQWNK